jgi:hypothetical protein
MRVFLKIVQIQNCLDGKICTSSKIVHIQKFVQILKKISFESYSIFKNV